MKKSLKDIIIGGIIATGLGTAGYGIVSQSLCPERRYAAHLENQVDNLNYARSAAQGSKASSMTTYSGGMPILVSNDAIPSNPAKAREILRKVTNELKESALEMQLREVQSAKDSELANRIEALSAATTRKKYDSLNAAHDAHFPKLLGGALFALFGTILYGLREAKKRE